MFDRLRYKIREHKFNKHMAKQRYERGFADCDCWGMSYWLTSTLPDMIICLRDMKHGAPEEPFEEFDKLPLDWKNNELKKLEKIVTKQGYAYEPDSIFTKWYIILTRLAYCLYEADEDKDMYNPYKEEFNKAFWGKDFYKIKTFDEFIEQYTDKTDKGRMLKTNPVDEELNARYWNKEKEIQLYKIAMKDEAMDLLKKYFYNLWD